MLPGFTVRVPVYIRLKKENVHSGFIHEIISFMQVKVFEKDIGWGIKKLKMQVNMFTLFLFYLIIIVRCNSVKSMHYYHTPSSSTSEFNFERTYRHPKPSLDTLIHGHINSVVGASSCQHKSSFVATDRNIYPRGFHSGLIRDYFDHGKYTNGPPTWGVPSDHLPQHPSAFPLNFFPCPKLEKALRRAKVNFNLAVDDKWNDLTHVEATIFREDLTALCNVFRSDFHRASEKLRKSGQFSCARQESFYEAVRIALEDLVAHSQQSAWYTRLRRFVGADTFHYIINNIASEEDN